MTLIKPGGFNFVCTDNKVHHQCDSVDSTVCRMSDSSSSLITNYFSILHSFHLL